VIEPSLQGAGDGEVVHRRGQHQHISGQQLIGEQVGQRQRSLLGFTLLPGRRHPAAQQVGVQMRHLINRKVTHLDLIRRIGSLPVGDKLRSQLTRNRTLLTGAAFNYQDVCHVVCSIEGLLNVDGAKNRSAQSD